MLVRDPPWGWVAWNSVSTLRSNLTYPSPPRGVCEKVWMMSDDRPSTAINTNSNVPKVENWNCQFLVLVLLFGTSAKNLAHGANFHRK